MKETEDDHGQNIREYLQVGFRKQRLTESGKQENQESDRGTRRAASSRRRRQGDRQPPCGGRTVGVGESLRTLPS